jgi:hypothetical protein
VTWWEVIDVTDWPASDREPRGRRAKAWVTDLSGRRWLRKGIRGWEKVPGGSRPTEPAIEAFTLELARACGFDVAFGRPATWRSNAGEVRGFVSRMFHDDSEEQFTGAEIVESGADDERQARIAATPTTVRRALERLSVARGADLLGPFVRMLAFDAWIGNGDRHLGNWAVLVSADVCRLAPMFDTAGCLGAELGDRAACLRPDAELQEYAAGCRSGFGDGVADPGLHHSKLVEIVRGWPEWRSAYEDLVPRFNLALSNDVDALLAEVPEAWWPTPRRQFARRLLEVRVRILEGAVP